MPAAASDGGCSRTPGPTGWCGRRSDAGVVRPGDFTIVVDASAQNVRWSLTVTQPE